MYSQAPWLLSSTSFQWIATVSVPHENSTWPTHPATAAKRESAPVQVYCKTENGVKRWNQLSSLPSTAPAFFVFVCGP